MTEWITLHRMVHVVESLTIKLYDGEEPPKSQDEADQMFHEHVDDYNATSSMDEIVDYDMPHSYTDHDVVIDDLLRHNHYVSLEDVESTPNDGLVNAFANMTEDQMRKLPK